jgi:flagellin
MISMSMYINTNVSAINAHRNLGFNNNTMGKTMEKLSSGFRINRAADDAAGLAISEKMRQQIGGYKQAMRNAQDGVSLIQTAEGALTEVHSMLQRINVLANQASNGTYQNSDRDKLDLEVQQLLKEIDNISKSVEFNGVKLLDANSSVKFQIGPYGSNTLTAKLSKMDSAALGVDSNVKTAAAASSMIAKVSSAIGKVNTRRADFGSIQNRLEHTIQNLGVTMENLSAAESRVRNADMAAEMTEFTRNQILVQAGTAMLAQANAMPQGVLKLLG